MAGAGDQEQFLVVRAGGFLEGVFRHVEGVGLAAGCLFGTLGGRFGQTFLRRGLGGAQEAVAAYDAGVEHGQDGNGLDALIRLGSLQGVSAAATDAECADTVRIHARERGNDVDHAMNIFHTEGRVIEIAGRTATGTLEGGIGCHGDVAGFGQTLCVQAGHLLLDTAVRVGHDDGRILFVGLPVIACRRIDVGGNGVAVQVVRDRMDIHLAGFVLRDSAAIDQAERIGVRALDLAQGNFFQILRAEERHQEWTLVPFRPLLEKCSHS